MFYGHAVVTSSAVREIAKWLRRKAAHQATPQIKECAGERDRIHAK
jgi:hypothetical protein